MKHLFLILLFFISTNTAPNPCEEDLYREHLLSSKELRDVTRNYPEGQDAWHILYKSDELDLAKDKDALLHLVDHIKSSNKSVEDILKDIKDSGGYRKWRNLADGTKILWKSADEMRKSVNDWALAYQKTLPQTTRQLNKFNKACIASYKKADGNVEVVFGRNGGVLNTEASQPTISAQKKLGLHKDLSDRLPETTKWPQQANCAECDAVNQALHNGAKWEDIQIHTIDIRPNGTLSDVIQCNECQDIFKGMHVTSQ